MSSRCLIVFDIQIVDEVLKEHNSSSTLYRGVPIKILEGDVRELEEIAEQHKLERHEMYK
jgi:hypothetical protein